MYPSRFVQYLNLPAIPQEIIDTLVLDVKEHHKQDNTKVHGPYIWSDYQTEKLNAWCKQNISDDLYYGIQLMVADVPTHTDFGTKTKINFVIDTGGDQVLTKFYDLDQKTLLDSYQIEPLRWHIFKADFPHEIVNITGTRVSVTARIF